MLDYALLSALAAVVRTGGFDRAAQQLGLTPSAVSQRVKLLEERMGTVLVVRGQPCRATESGLHLCQHVERVALLEDELRHGLPQAGLDASRLPLRLAVNADSLATWFIPALAAMPDRLFDLVLDDQEHSADWLRRGEVLGAVTGYGRAVQGCDSTPLGALRYIATASPDFMARWFPDGVTETAATQAPCLTFNRKDRLQQLWLEQAFGRDLAPPTHWLPATQAFVDAALAGLGWGLNLERMVAEHLKSGRLVPLRVDLPLDVPLYWQQSRSVGTALADLRRAVRTAAGEALHPIAVEG
ncbi:LysR family transcriptional regulator ArgP [Fodinicurvata fenggangensis]|uniref:LysR family transcriptional regulator ArgP n=1 Tax=Fodinicurvata fenggangensis TaxID=1121830 RepID=UPI00047D1B88|nr:LysR family transcriptional regulator ArgP [Fodinicurvata fenggangensis]